MKPILAAFGRAFMRFRVECLRVRPMGFIDKNEDIWGFIKDVKLLIP